MPRRNRIYKDSIYKQINKENKQILSNDVLEMKSNRKTEKTIYQYATDIKMFFCQVFNELDNKSILDLRNEIFVDSFSISKTTGQAQKDLNRVQCSEKYAGILFAR